MLDSEILSGKLGFRIPIVSGIADSLSCISDSKSKNFPDSETDPDSLSQVF